MADARQLETSQYEQRKVSAFLYEPLLSEDGTIRDFRIVYASERFISDWQSIYHDENYLGALLQGSGLLDDYSLQMLRQFHTVKPHPFVSYLPRVNLHLYFEPITDAPAPYAGFYLTNLTDYAARDAKAHFLRNIQQINNNAVLLRMVENGRMEALFVSQKFAEMMECSASEAQKLMSGMGFFKTTNPEDRPLVRSMLRNRVAYDGSTDLTIQKITAGKNRIWCNVHYSFIDDFDEHYIYCTYSNVDALKQYEEKLRSTYSSLGNNFYHINEKTLALFRVNLTRDSFEEVKGRDLFESDSIAFTYSEALRQRSAHYPIFSEQRQFLQTFSKDELSAGYLAGRTNVSQVIYSLRKDGRSCFVNLSASVTRHPLTGDLVAFLTEQECNSDKVKETLMDKILAQQFDMVCYLVNGQYGVTIGQRERIKRGNVFPVTNSGNYRQYLMNQVRPVLSGTEAETAAMFRALSPEAVEANLKVKEPYVVNIAIEIDGETYYKQFDFYSIDPDARFYILLKSDTTEIQKQHIALNEQLQDALEAANQANVAKTAFLSSMSHEIRTPMNAIIGLDSIALSEPNLSERTREHLEKIGASARHLLGLINDILDMSRIESGRMVIRNEEFSFAEMLEQVNTMMGSQCQEKGLHYECRVLGRIDNYYIGDVMKLKQIIINILGNAVKFTDAPGSVQFHIEKTAEYDGLSNFRFIMRDTGIGMDAGYLPKIFEPFSQEDSSGNNRYGSTGLGLAITKNIVEMMNGRIEVESEKGLGSSFTVDIPLRNSEKKRAASIAVRPTDLKVLVIDDDPIACEHAEIVLAELGIAADLCLSGKEALETIRLKAARREAYNLILVDWKMPEMDGLAVTREIRRITGSESAVIVLTAYNWDEIEAEATEAGVDSFMAKPLFASHVLSAYEQAAAKRQDNRTAPVKAQLNGRRILLAEDMLINAEIMKELLKMRGMEADHAENGQAAVDLFLQKPVFHYDAILMDLRMPVMDGLTASETIRASGRADSKTIPILALTANAFDEDVQRSLRSGMNAHLSKPVEPEQLYKALEDLIVF